jgi:hypothetical protein
VATLARGTGIDATELHRLTAGNPFFVTEVLQTGSDALPVSVRDAVLARTRTLSTPARDALEVAALVGSRMQAELLVSLVNDPVIMDELISQDLLIKDGNDLRFRHEIARVAIEAAVPPYRTAAIHSKIMDALLSSGCNDNARLAFPRRGCRECRARPQICAEGGPSCCCTGCPPGGCGSIRAGPAFRARDRYPHSG